MMQSRNRDAAVENEIVDMGKEERVEQNKRVALRYTHYHA